MKTYFVAKRKLTDFISGGRTLSISKKIENKNLAAPFKEVEEKKTSQISHSVLWCLSLPLKSANKAHSISTAQKQKRVI